MGTCGMCHNKKNQFTIEDLTGMDRYFTLMSKRKVDIFQWLMTSDGPWETPESFLNFKQSNVRDYPIKISNEEEIRIQLSDTYNTNVHDEVQKMSLLHVEHNDSMLKVSSSTSTVTVSTFSATNNETLSNLQNEW